MRGLLGGNQSADKHRMVPPFIFLNMKKILSFLLLVSVMSGYAHDFVINEIAYQKLSATTCEVTRFCTATDPSSGKSTYDYDYYKGDIIIPSTVTDGGTTYEVVAIGANAFYKSKITSINIPETVTAIRDEAFEGSEQLTAINIGKNITQLNDTKDLVETFNGCYALEEINVDPYNTVFASIDGVLLSKDKKTLLICPAGKRGSYVTPPGVETIREYAFYKCISLTGITLSDDVISVENSSLLNCKNLTTLVIGKNVSTIGESAFKTSKENSDVKLVDVTNYSTVPQIIPYEIFSYVTTSSGVLHVLSGCKSAYQTSDVWKEFNTILEDATLTGIMKIENPEEVDVVKSVLLNGQISNGQRGVTIKKMKDNSIRMVLTR
jgi:hypothetical protein